MISEDWLLVGSWHRYERSKGRYDRGSWPYYERSKGRY